MKNINIEGIKRILKKGTMVLIPLALASTMVLSGCSTEPREDKLIKEGEKQGIVISKVDNDLFTYDELLYRFDKFDIESDFGEHVHVERICNPEEFGKIVGEENISWDDIKVTIKNKKFDKEMEDILLGGVDNLKEKLPDVNLSILNYNIKNLKIIYSYDEVGKEEADNYYGDFYEIAGQFEDIGDIMYLNPKIKNDKKRYRDSLIHELLGHGLTLGYTELEGGVRSTLSNIYANTDKSNKDFESLRMNCHKIGGTVEEAVAAMITVLATGEKMYEVNRENDGPYDMYILELQLLLSSTNTSLSELINNGLDSFINKMHKMGCPVPIDYLYEFDQRKDIYLSGYECDENNMLENVLYKYLMEMCLNNKEISNVEEMKQYSHSCLDSINKYIKLDTYEGEKYVSWTNDSICEMVYIDSLKQDIDESLSSNSYYDDSFASNKYILK